MFTRTVSVVGLIGLVASSGVHAGSFSEYENSANVMEMTCRVEQTHANGISTVTFQYDGESFYLNGNRVPVGEKISPPGKENVYIHVKQKGDKPVFLWTLNKKPIVVEWYVNFPDKAATLKAMGRKSHANCM